jgi:hypothetical protein
MSFVEKYEKGEDKKRGSVKERTVTRKFNLEGKINVNKYLGRWRVFLCGGERVFCSDGYI